MIDVSVIVPLYNKKDWMVGECIDSIEAQKKVNYEIIVIDDASNSTDYIDARATQSHLKPDLFKVIHHNENKGTQWALDTGFTEARGKYACVVDADDVLAYQALYSMYNFMEVNEFVDYGWSKYEAMDEDGSNIRPGKRCAFDNPKSQKDVIMQNLVRFSTFHLKMIRMQSYFDSMKPWREMPQSGVDYCFVLENMYHCEMRRFDIVGYYYRNKVKGGHSHDSTLQKKLSNECRKQAIENGLAWGWLDENDDKYIKDIVKQQRENERKKRVRLKDARSSMLNGTKL